MPWSLLFSFLSSIPGALGKYFDQKNQIELQKQQNQLEIEKERAKLIAQGIIAQSELGQEQIKATSPWFKQFVYFILLSPIIVTCYDPAWGKQIFDSLNIVPEWYIAIVSTLSLAIWGINSDKLHQIIQARRNYKLEKLKINRQAYFDEKRKIQGPLSQQEVDKDNQLLDNLGV